MKKLLFTIAIATNIPALTKAEGLFPPTLTREYVPGTDIERDTSLPLKFRGIQAKCHRNSFFLPVSEEPFAKIHNAIQCLHKADVPMFFDQTWNDMYNYVGQQCTQESLTQSEMDPTEFASTCQGSYKAILLQVHANVFKKIEDIAEKAPLLKPTNPNTPRTNTLDDYDAIKAQREKRSLEPLTLTDTARLATCLIKSLFRTSKETDLKKTLSPVIICCYENNVPMNKQNTWKHLHRFTRIQRLLRKECHPADNDLNNLNDGEKLTSRLLRAHEFGEIITKDIYGDLHAVIKYTFKV